MVILVLCSKDEVVLLYYTGGKYEGNGSHEMCWKIEAQK